MVSPDVTTLHTELGIAIPSAVHPEHSDIEAQTLRWVRQMGFVRGDESAGPLARARFHLAAARFLPCVPIEDATLFSQWTTWFFLLDDEQDDGRTSPDRSRVLRVYDDLLAVVDTKHPAPSAGRLPLALADLWQRTTPGMSAAWRKRFVAQMGNHRDAFLEQADNRAHGRTSRVEDYPRLRRRANGEHMFNLFEVAHHAEIPAPLARTGAWSELAAATNDITAWCNDIASYDRESAAGDTTNFVAVFRHALCCDTPTAMDHVKRRIRRRLVDLRSARHLLDEETHRLGFDQRRQQIALVADTLADLPGTHFGWLLDSGRYAFPPAAHRAGTPDRGGH